MGDLLLLFPLSKVIVGGVLPHLDGGSEDRGCRTSVQIVKPIEAL